MGVLFGYIFWFFLDKKKPGSSGGWGFFLGIFFGFFWVFFFFGFLNPKPETLNPKP